MKTARLISLKVLLATSPGAGGKSQSLDRALAHYLPQLEESRDRALAQHLAYTSLRWLGATEFISRRLMKKPLKAKDRDIHLLIQLGLVQLWREAIPAHAAVHETAAVARGLGKAWAVALINGVLRNFQRRRQELEAEVESSPARWSCPEWLVQELKLNWPENWQNILNANNQAAPMWLRVNLQKYRRDEYLELLQNHNLSAIAGKWSAASICMEQAVPVNQLPDFAEGAVSVQDSAAQLAAEILAPQAGDRVLDACAAPGSKTCQLLELEPKIAHLTALDNSDSRLNRLRENLQRLQLDCEIICGDASQSSTWWDGQHYDRILLDAPCSSTGVIRRHPDIRWRRKPEDISTISKVQTRILSECWNMLKPGGRLLYATCSVLPTENQQLISKWLATVNDVVVISLEVDWGLVAGDGRQLLPGSSNEDSDGFFYCLLEKTANA